MLRGVERSGRRMGDWTFQSHNLGTFRQAGMYGEARGDRFDAIRNFSAHFRQAAIQQRSRTKN